MLLLRSCMILVLVALSAMSALASEVPTSSWFRHCEKDTPTPVEGVLEGEVPSWLEGRLTRVGPGRLHVGNTSYIHIFDPLALLHLVTFSEGRVTYTSKFLKSDVYKKNMEAQRISVNSFATASFPDPCQTLLGSMASWFSPEPQPSDNCLVNIVQAKDQLLAMTETNEVRVVDPENLDTVGEKITISDYVTVRQATAHPHIAPDGTVYNLASSSGNRGPVYSIISLPDGQFENAKLEATILSRWRFHPGYMHSFAITENYYILFETPLTMSAAGILSHVMLGHSIEEAMAWFPYETTRFRVIDRRTGLEHPTTFTSDAFFTFHQINAFETDDDMLVIDLSSISSGEVIKALYFENLKKDNSDPTKQKYDTIAKRFVLPLRDITAMSEGAELLENIPEAQLEGGTAKASAKKVDDHIIYLEGLTINPTFFEMPRINYAYNSKPYRYAYGVGTEGMSFDFTSLIKLDVRTGEKKVWSDPEYIVSEPVFVASPESQSSDLEDEGVVLSVLLHRMDAHKISLLVLNARDFTQVAKVEFDIQGSATQTFHGQYVGAFDEVHGY